MGIKIIKFSGSRFLGLFLLCFFCNLALGQGITITPSVTNVNCNGASTGAITLSTVSGGTPPYTYLWSNTSTSQNISSLPAGTYTVTVTDNASNTATSTSTVTQPVALIASAKGAPLTCNGCPYTNATATVNVTGGTAGYSYYWNTGATTQSLTNISTGTYSITVTDSKSCSATSSVTVSTLTVSINGYSACGGSGSATATASNGTSPYTYLWSTTATTSSISGLSNGTYTVTVTDAGNTTVAQTVTINSVAPLTTSGNVSICNGNSTQLSASGATTYSWYPTTGLSNPNIANPIASPTATTTYTVTGSTTTNLITNGDFSSGNTGFNTGYGYVSPPDHGNGSIAGNYGLDVSSIVYNPGWNPTTHDHTTGTGNFMICDASGIPNTVIWQQTVTVTPNSTYTLSAWIGALYSASPATMRFAINGVQLGPIFTASTTISAWTNFTADWTAGTGVTSATITVIDTNLTPGGNDFGFDDVSFTTTCVNTAQVTVTVNNVSPPSVSATTSNITACSGEGTGSATLTVTSGASPYNYIWSNSATTQNLTGIITPGTYTVTVTDQNSCTATTSATITQPSAVSTTITANNIITCLGETTGGVTLAVSGGSAPYSYLWSNSATTQNITGVSAGTYSVTVTDQNSCTKTASATVTQPGTLTSSLSFSAPACYGLTGSVTNTVAGGTTPYAYQWSNGATTQNLSGITPGTYSTTVTDANGCSSTASTTVTQPAQLSATILGKSVTCALCDNGAATLTVTGGTTPYTYYWTNNGYTSQNLTNIGVGTYTVNIVDHNSCTTTASTTISRLLASIVGQSTCDGTGGGASVTAAGGNPPYSYSWSNGISGTSQSGLTNGTYVVTVSDVGGATVSQTVVISNSVVSLTLGPNTAICDGKSTTLSASGATYYAWMPSTGLNNDSLANPVASPTITTTYSVTGSATSGQLVTNGNFNFSDGDIGFNSDYGFVSSAANAATSGGDGGLNPEGYFAIDSNSHNYNINFASIHDHTTGTGDFMIVNGAPGAGVIIWTQTIGVFKNATYNFNAWICTLDTFNQNFSTLRFSINGILLGTTITAPSVPGVWIEYTTSWNAGDDTTALIAIVNQDTVANGNDFGLDDISFTTTCTNTAVAQVTVAVNPLPVPSVSGTNVNCYGNTTGAVSLGVTNGTLPYTYSWSNSATSQNLSSVAAGTYTVTVSDKNLCTATASATVTQPVVLTATATASNKSKLNHNDGTVTLTPTGGTTAYSYNWSNSSTSQNLSSLAAGNYIVTVTDINGCTATTSAVVNNPTGPCTCIATGNWKSDPTWTGNCSGGGGVYAGNLDNISLQGYRLTVDSVQMVKSLIMNSSPLDTTMLLPTGTGQLTVLDSFDINTTTSGKDVKVALNGSSGIKVNGNMNINHSNGHDVNIFLNDQSGSAAKLLVTGNLIINLNSGANNVLFKSYSTNDTLQINGNLQLNNNINNVSNLLQMIWNSSGNMIVAGSINFNPVRAGNTQIQLNGSSTLQLQGDITRPSSPYKFGSFTSTGNSTLLLYGSGQETLPDNAGNGTDSFTYQNITVNKSSGVKVNLGTNTIANGTLTISHGIFEVPASLTATVGKVNNTSYGTINVLSNGLLKIP